MSGSNLEPPYSRKWALVVVLITASEYDQHMLRYSTGRHTRRVVVPLRYRHDYAAISLLVFVFCLGLIEGCKASNHFRAGIQAENPGDRILAIHAAGEARDRQSVPLLVDRLEDEDEGVRFFAIQALERITGQRFGYDYTKPSPTRARAVEKWRDYVKNGLHVVSDGNTDGNVRGRTVGSASALE